MKINKRTKKSIGSMTFKQLMEAFTSDDETSNIDGFDEFEDADYDAEGDVDLEDAEADTEADGEGEITVSLTMEEVEVLRSILAKIDGEEDVDLEGEDTDEDFEDEDADEDFEDEDADEDEDDDTEEGETPAEDEEEDCENVNEEEEVTVTNGAPTKKVGTPAYSNKSTVDSVYTRGAKSGHGAAATVSGQGPTKKVGTPATGEGNKTVQSKIAPGKHVFEI